MTLKIVHYLNQFFGQYGGETAASMAVVIREEPVGPGLNLQKCFGEKAEVVATVICGDNHIAENLDAVTAEIVAQVEKYRPDVFIAGPAYEAGRYGVACGSLCRAVQKQLGIPAVTAMHGENPGVAIYKRDLFILKTGNNARSMSRDMANIAAFARKLLSDVEIGAPDAEGYFERGLIRNVPSPRRSTERLVDMLLDKFHGRPFQTEVMLPAHDDVPRAPLAKDLTAATVVLVTDGGLYPAGNPDQMPSSNPDRFHAYSIEGRDDLHEGDWTICHNGYDSTFVLADPDRLVPVDAMRELEKEGVIGKLHDHYLGTTGLITTVENSRKIGRAMATYIKEHNIDAAVLTST
jgi:glycine/betaine/sarcosine/D-proline reductase family selenoprotein B